MFSLDINAPAVDFEPVVVTIDVSVEVGKASRVPFAKLPQHCLQHLNTAGTAGNVHSLRGPVLRVDKLDDLAKEMLESWLPGTGDFR